MVGRTALSLAIAVVHHSVIGLLHHVYTPGIRRNVFFRSCVNPISQVLEQLRRRFPLGPEHVNFMKSNPNLKHFFCATVFFCFPVLK